MCWICEGWAEYDLSWYLIKSGYDYKDPAFIHLNYLNFQSTFLGEHDNTSFHAKMMMPPGKNYFFYSFNFKDVTNKLIPTVRSDKF